jgi:bifunctional DNA primase/polymerase-like protein
MNSDRDLTLEAIRTRRWRVVLLGPRAKKPHTKTWEITTDADRVAVHLERGGNLGLLAGETAGLVALDPDQMLLWADMIEDLGQPAAAWTLTGRGRLHYFAQWVPDLPAGLEWNGTKVGEIQRGPSLQQIVIPPSVHPDTGRHYEWLVDPVTQPIEPLPGLWRAYLTAFTYEKRYGRRH